MVVATAVKDGDGRKMIMYQPTREQEVAASLITYINCAFKGALELRTSKELAEYILSPDYVGEMTLYDIHTGEKEESSIGIKFLYSINQSAENKIVDGHKFQGLILDKNGLGFIEGLDRIVNDTTYKTFTKKNVTLFGLARQDSVYNCAAITNSGIYNGTILNPTSKGIINVCPDDIQKAITHAELNSYYKEFLRQDFMKEERLMM